MMIMNFFSLAVFNCQIENQPMVKQSLKTPFSIFRVSIRELYKFAYFEHSLIVEINVLPKNVRKFMWFD